MCKTLKTLANIQHRMLRKSISCPGCVTIELLEHLVTTHAFYLGDGCFYLCVLSAYCWFYFKVLAVMVKTRLVLSFQPSNSIIL